MRRHRSLALTSLAFTMILATGRPAWSADEPIAFSVIGDVPYSESELTVLEQHVVKHNLYSPSDFFVHLGDLLGSSESCFEGRYVDVAEILMGLAVPAYIVPGDNEWNDCSNPDRAWRWWTEHLLGLEENFCGTPPIEAQSVRLENFAFVSKGVLFVGINLVGGSVQSQKEWNARMQQDADWVSQQLQAKRSQVRAAVLFAQAGPSSNRKLFFDQFVVAAAAFGKPVLFAQGDGHSWILDHPFSAQNVLRMQVERGTTPPVRVTATLDPRNPFQFVRSPWPKGTRPLNRPPCVEVGPDLSIDLGEVVALDGFVTDDQDPPGTLTTRWSREDGPDGVAFTDPSSVATTATFSTAGSYELRLMADDGELTGGDGIAIEVIGPPECDDGLDNDGDGTVDSPDDPGCDDTSDASEHSQALACDDGLDDDADGLADFPADPGCQGPSSGTESPECDDESDNDGDGRIDWDGGWSGGIPDSSCGGRGWEPREKRSRCGLGFEVALLLPLFVRLRRLRHLPTGRPPVRG